MLVAVDEALDGAVERGREQQGLVTALDVAEHPLDLGHEPHVGHAVGLVEDDQADVGEVGELAVDQVDEPPGGGHDDLGTRLERVDLLGHLRAAVHGDQPQVSGFDQGSEHVGHLDGELAGGHQHEARRTLGRGLGDPLDEGKPERERLARSGLRLAADVAAREGVGDAEALDGKRGGEAGIVEHGHQIF